MKDLVRMFARPAMRHNPHSWLSVFMLRRGQAVPVFYALMDVGILPEWLR
jgi:hypothetical protein